MMIPDIQTSQNLVAEASARLGSFHNSSNGLANKTESSTSIEQLPATANPGIVKFLLENAPVETFAVALTLFTAAIIKLTERSLRRREYRKGINLESVPVQINLIAENEGQKYLIFRNLYTTEVSDMIPDALTGVFAKIARKASQSPPDYLLRFKPHGKYNLLSDIACSIGGHANHFTEAARNYCVFVTCENPDLSMVNFHKKARVFIIAEEDIAKFADPDIVASLATEKDIHSQRIATLHAICHKLKKGELAYGEDYTISQLRIKTSDYSPIDQRRQQNPTD